MSDLNPPLLLEPDDLKPLLGDDSKALLLVDVCSMEEYASGHVPGAIHLSPGALQHGSPPAPGRIPEPETLSALFSDLGLRDDVHVIAMDHEGGGWAARLIWTLDAVGHFRYSYLNGGYHAWIASGGDRETTARYGERSDFNAEINSAPIASAEDIMTRLGQADFRVWDARSAQEYRGEKVLAQRGGHIPGAVNLDWLQLFDPNRDYRLLEPEDLRDMLARLDLKPEHHIVAHCQTHHRSSLAYLVMKLLGYEHIQGYDGSWSEWGNRLDTPIEGLGD